MTPETSESTEHAHPASLPRWPDGPLELEEALALAATLIPAGQATSYGGLAAALGTGGPRQAGRAMSRSPEGTPWWRVVRADGTLPPSLITRAAPHWAQEQTPLKTYHHHIPDDETTARVDLTRAGWQPSAADLTQLDALRTRLGGLSCPA